MYDVDHQITASILVGAVPCIALVMAALTNHDFTKRAINNYFASFGSETTVFVSITVACFCTFSAAVLAAVILCAAGTKSDYFFLDAEAVFTYFFVCLVPLWLVGIVSSKSPSAAARTSLLFLLTCFCFTFGKTELFGWAMNQLPLTQLAGPTEATLSAIKIELGIPNVSVVSSSSLTVQFGGAVNFFFSEPVLILEKNIETRFTPDQLLGIVVHELGHLHYMDASISMAYRLFAAGLLCVFVYVLAQRKSACINSAVHMRRCFIGLFIAFSLLCGNVLISAHQERRADKFAASHGYGPGLISAIKVMVADGNPTFASSVIYGSAAQRIGEIDK
jgi:hypothetical protein